ncbi:MAG: hydrogenase maturation nickel metallochaperone HypA [Actinomycetota bacterium]
MHELAITESIVEAIVERVGESRVETVTLVIGELSGVVADSVRFCFEVCTKGTLLEGATLEILEVPGRAWCGACRAEVELHDPIPLCGCGSANLEIVSGQELTIKQVEVAV